MSEPPGTDAREATAEEPMGFEDYAFVTAGVTDGIELGALLRYRQIDPEAWRQGKRYWDARVVADADRLDGLMERLSAEQMEARRSWARPIPPLDEDLRAFIHFQRRLSEENNPLGYLERLGLSPTDLLLLSARWQEAIAKDRALAERVADWSAEPLRPVEVPPPGPPRLPGTEASAGADPFDGRAEPEPQSPEAGPESPAADVAPSLSVPLPRPAGRGAEPSEAGSATEPGDEIAEPRGGSS